MAAGSSKAPMASANAWSTEEDAELKQLVSRDGEGRWPTKAKSFSTERNAPALRLRWHHHKEWTAKMERSLQSSDRGRVHLHGYFSAFKCGELDTTDLEPLQFQGVKPRIDMNREARGPV